CDGTVMIDFRQASDLSHKLNSASVYHGGANIIDELLLDELLAIVNRIENLADRNRRGGVPADKAQTFLQLRRNRIFQPEQVKRFETLSEARRFDWRQPVMHIVQQGKIFAKFFAQPLK